MAAAPPVTLRVALAQVDLVVGDLEGNADAVVAWAHRATEAGADVVVLPEMTLTGYPPEDLVLRRSFAQACATALAALAPRLAAEGLGDLTVVVGHLSRDEDGPRNSAAVLHGGAVVASYDKHHLPTYGVFDEHRYFRPGRRAVVVRIRGVDVALTICEDLWVDGGPLAAARAAEAGLVLCLNGSPYERRKDETREQLLGRRAPEAGCPIAYVNLVGGQDELVFDGGSFVVDATGTLVARAPQFVEHLLVTDLEVAPASSDLTGEAASGPGTTMTLERATASTAPPPDRAPVSPWVAEPLDDCPEVWAALTLCTRDYVRKNGFRSVALGLSGGIDSAVVATLAADALGPDAVHVVGMPSRWSSDHSISDAEDLATRQGLHWSLLPIAPVVQAYTAALEPLGGLDGLAAENLQARVRGTALMALSNQHGHLILTTGNKSELATGFSTLYGDSAGGFAPIKDVPKSLVWELARWRNAVAETEGATPPIPENSIAKPPSAELAPGQMDSDRLPDYTLLDALLTDYVDRDLGRDALLARGHDPLLVERVIRLVDLAEYKRRQNPPGPKISLKAFGRDRRLPITSRWREPVQGAHPG